MIAPMPEPAANKATSDHAPLSTARRHARHLVAKITPHDTTEAGHQTEVLEWIDSGAPLWRMAKPATPPMHLVSYAVVLDPTNAQVLLVDHRKAELWLPTGGHVEPGEHPAVTARRELSEELAITPEPYPHYDDHPVFVTVTATVGNETSHTDVSLWFAFATTSDTPLQPDPDEFVDTRWWPIDAVAHRSGTRFDPHLPRFLAKIGDQAQEFGILER